MLRLVKNIYIMEQHILSFHQTSFMEHNIYMSWQIKEIVYICNYIIRFYHSLKCVALHFLCAVYMFLSTIQTCRAEGSCYTFDIDYIIAKFFLVFEWNFLTLNIPERAKVTNAIQCGVQDRGQPLEMGAVSSDVWLWPHINSTWAS